MKQRYAQFARELKEQSEAANPQVKKASRRSAKTKRPSEASSGQSLGESSGQSSDQPSNNSLPSVSASMADPANDNLRQYAEL